MQKRKKEALLLLVLVPILVYGILNTRKESAMTKARKEKADTADTADTGKKPKRDKDFGNITKPLDRLKIAYIKGPRDPFTNRHYAYLHKLRGDEPVTDKVVKRQVALPKFEIKGLIWNTEVPQAIVDNDIVKSGDFVKGVRVVKIEKKGIMVDHQGELVFVPIRKLEGEGKKRKRPDPFGF